MGSQGTGDRRQQEDLRRSNPAVLILNVRRAEPTDYCLLTTVYFPHSTLPCASPCAEPVVRELGASRCAPSSTPTPRRSTSSPPSQPVAPASRKATKPATRAAVVGRCAAVGAL